MKRRQGLSIVVAVLMLVIIAVAGVSIFHYFYTAHIARLKEAAAIRISVNAELFPSEDYSELPPDVSALETEHGCLHMLGYACHLTDKGVPQIVARCQYCHEPRPPPEPGFRHTEIDTHAFAMFIHPGPGTDGKGRYEECRNCPDCHARAHNIYSSEEITGACLKVGLLEGALIDSPVCHSALGVNKRHTDEVCLKAACHKHLEFKPHNSYLIVVFVINVGTASCEVSDILVNSRSVEWRILPMEGCVESVTLEPREKVALQLIGPVPLPGTTYEFEVLTTTGVSSGKILLTL